MGNICRNKNISLDAKRRHGRRPDAHARGDAPGVQLCVQLIHGQGGKWCKCRADLGCVHVLHDARPPLDCECLINYRISFC